MRRTTILSTLLLAVGLGFAPGPAAGQGVAKPGEPAPHGLRCDDGHPCRDVLPGAVSFEAIEGKPYARGLDAAGEPVGWIVLSTDVVDIKGYSGKPLATLVGLDPEGRITGGRVVHHSEPILLVGIPEQKLHDFVNSYTGLQADARVVVGGTAADAHHVDMVSGATVTILAENRTVLETAQALGQDVGVLEIKAQVPGHFVRSEERWTWAQIVQEGALARLVVTQEQMGLPPGDQPFVDLWFGIADPPQVGIPLLGERIWQRAVDALEPGEHLVVVFGDGTGSFKGSGFVRGGTFDRVRIEQGLRTVMFTDLDYTNIQPPPAEDAPRFREAALFVARSHALDPGAPFDLVFLGSSFDLKGGFSRAFHTFKTTHRTPKTVYVLDGPDPETVAIQQAWKSRPFTLGFVVLYLLSVAGVFAARRWTAGEMHRLERIHTGYLLVTFFVLGLGLSLQPSVTQLLTLIGGVVGEWRWGLFLSDPFLFLSWIFIAGVTVVWGRGVFCGWTCPYGAMNELTFKVGRRLKLPEYELPDSVHNKARYIRYGVLAVLVIAYLIHPETGERMAEVEPFKSTFFVRPWSRHVLLFGWWILLFGSSLFVYRPFCRYLCPLGAALAVPSSFRLSGPHRREFCSKGCRICPRGCEPRAIRKDGTIDPRECLNCWECEANYNDDEVCPPLVQIRRQAEKAAKVSALLAVGLLAATGAPSTAEAARLVVGVDAPTVQGTLDRAHDGDVVVLPEGVWTGPARVERSITLRSEGGVLDGGGEGTALRVAAPGARISGLQVRNSGRDRAGPDACIYVEPSALSAVVERSTLSECLFGIWVHQGHGVRVEDNTIAGRADVPNASERGNGIHLFDSQELVVRGNRVTGSRDGVYVSATHHSVIDGNTLEGLRYGIHYMFSFDNTVSRNRTCGNTSGIALMQSSRLKIIDNTACDNERHGILFRDVQYTEVSGNTVEGNGEGLFFFSSLDNEIVGNRIAHNVIGARVWAGTERNVVKGNSFVGNRQQVYFVARDDQDWGDADGGNYWSDYLGWDQDGDGLGDRPYRVDSLLSRLLYEHPAAVLLLHSPTLELLTRLQQSLPALRVPTIIDRHPLPAAPGVRP
jgi:NosR/NirI family nitrous oxide reductase transcriptional regulator